MLYTTILGVLSVLLAAGLALRFSTDLLRSQSEGFAFQRGEIAESWIRIQWDEESPEALDHLMKEAAKKFGIPRWSVVNHSQETILGTEGGLEVETWTRESMKTPSRNRRARQIQDHLVWVFPLPTRESSIGVSMDFPVESAMAGIQRAWTSVIIYTLLFTVIFLWFGYRLIRFIVVQPLKDLEDAASEVARGNIRAPVVAGRKNEIGRLGEAINAMRNRLLEDQERLAKHAQEQEELNEELERAQKALLRGERLASIGQLASGIAHEVGNPLGAVLGYISLLKDETKDEETKDLLERSEADLIRIRKILRQLLDYARPHIPNAVEIDVSEVVDSTVQGLKSQGIPEGVSLSISMDQRPFNVETDPDLLRQILWNLLLNAVDAQVEKGPGKVTIHVSKVLTKDLEEGNLGFVFRTQTRSGDRLKPEVLWSRHLQRESDLGKRKATRQARKGLPLFFFDPQAELVQILLEDEGEGIPEENIKRLFDPFFTTKAPGKGTGLGLFVTLNLVESLLGFLDVVPSKPFGTRFILLIPCRPEAKEAPSEKR